MNNIFSTMFKLKVENRLSTTPVFYAGHSTTGVEVTEQSAMRVAAVYACVRVIAEAIGSLPLKVYEHSGGSMQAKVDHPLYDILHLAPNPEMTSLDLRETLTAHLLLYGNAYAQIIRNGMGQVLSLYPLLPNKVDVNRNENGEIYYTYWRNYDETRPQEKSGGVTLSAHEVLHIHGLSFDGLVGYSPIALARNAIGMAVATENYGASFFANGANPGGILEHPGTLNDQETIRKTWEALYKGKGAHRVAVLEDGMKFHQVGIPPEQAQFLETRKFQLSEIARIFKVPPHMIGDLEKSTFSNIEQQSMEFVKFTLTPWVERFEQAMNTKLLSLGERKKYIIKFNLDGLLRGDYATRMNGYAIGRQNGWLSANDIRDLENMNPIPQNEGGDEYLVNGNMISIKDAAAGLAYKKEGSNNG